MLLSIDRESDEERRADLEKVVRHVLEDVRQAVEDWPRMRSKCLVLAAELEGTPPQGLAAEEVELSTRFLRWMAEDHFTFLGYRDYTLNGDAGGRGPRAGHRLGPGAAALRPAARPGARRPQPAGVPEGPRAADPRAHQGQLPLHGAPRRPPRLRRGQGVRRARRGRGGAPLPRALRVHGLHRVGPARAARRREGAGGPRPLGRRPRQPHRQGPPRGARELPARRAHPGQHRAALRHRHGGDPAAGAPPHQAVHPRGRLRPLRLLPRLHPP